MASGVVTATQSATSSVTNGTGDERNGPPKPQLEGEAKLRRFLRGYVSAQLRKKGYGELAAIVERETTRLMPSTLDEDEVAEVLTRMADQLNEERAQQFENMCVQLNLSQTNTKKKFNKVMVNLFQEGISWGNIITLVAFTGHIATYCARYNMDEQSIEVLNEADTYLHEQLLPWILEQGGWVSCPVCVCYSKYISSRLPLGLIGCTDKGYIVQRLEVCWITISLAIRGSEGAEVCVSVLFLASPKILALNCK